jgi:hypothetical protein
MAMDEPGLSLFRCICGRGIWALPSADIRCRCGGRMVGGRIENAKVPTVMYEKAVHFEHKRPV